MGLFITFEGPDGCGKTSIINLIKDYYKDNEKIIEYKKEINKNKANTPIELFLLARSYYFLFSSGKSILFCILSNTTIKSIPR